MVVFLSFITKNILRHIGLYIVSLFMFCFAKQIMLPSASQAPIIGEVHTHMKHIFVASNDHQHFCSHCFILMYKIIADLELHDQGALFVLFRDCSHLSFSSLKITGCIRAYFEHWHILVNVLATKI